MNKCTCHCGGEMFYRHMHAETCSLSKTGEEAPKPKSSHDALIQEAREIAKDVIEMREARAERLTIYQEKHDDMLSIDAIYQRAKAFLEKTKGR